MYPQHVAPVAGTVWPAVRQHSLANVEPVSYVPNVSSTESQTLAPEAEEQHGLVAPGVHAVPFVRVHVGPVQTPLTQVMPLPQT